MTVKPQTSLHVRRGQIATGSKPNPDSMSFRIFKPPPRLVSGHQNLGIHFLYPSHQRILSNQFRIIQIPLFIVAAHFVRPASQFSIAWKLE
jgi:hypothetical protein